MGKKINTKEALKKVYGNKIKPHLNYLIYLRERWEDEKDYEDFADYEKAVREKVKLNITKITKRPFGFHFRLNNQTLKFKITIKGNYYSSNLVLA